MARKQRSRGSGTLYQRGGHGVWIARWFDHAGKRREASTRTTDKAAAARILAKRVADVALRRDGVIDARTDQYADAERRPLSDHVGDWKASLTAKGITAKQVVTLLPRVKKLLGAVKAERLSDLSASAIQNAIGALHTNGKSLQTCQHYLRAVKQFSRWLNRDGRIRDDVLAHLTSYNAAADRRHERRPLTAEELGWLLDTTEHAPAWRRMTGADRAMLYRLAAGTGFRAGEIRSLTPGSFRLDDHPPAVVLRAADSKHRREDVQPIRSDLADLLRTWLAADSGSRVDRNTAGDPVARVSVSVRAVRDSHSTPVFGTMPEKTAMMIRADLRRARARWIRATANRQERRERRRSDFLAVIDGDGRVVDFHALRATYITMLVKGGASVKESQQLARHSDPKLTLNVYTKLGVHDLSGALDKLPNLTGDGPGQQRQRATGTYDAHADTPTDSRLYPRQLERETVRADASRCGGDSAETRTGDARNPLSATAQREVVQCNARGNGNAPGRTRTCDLRFRKPMLYPAELRAQLFVL